MPPVTAVDRSGGRRSQVDFQLVSPEEVAGLLAPSREGSSWKLLEAHFTSVDHPPARDANELLHIPGSIRMHPSYLEAGIECSKYYPDYLHPDDASLLPDEELGRALWRLGITTDTLVVVYGRGPDGAMAAARIVWALLYVGVSKVRLLDGGLSAWLASGGPTSPSIELAHERRREGEEVFECPSPWRVRPELLAQTVDVRELVEKTNMEGARLVDVRRRGEWEGTLRYCYPFFSEAGHIPTALHQGDWENLVEPRTHKMGPMLATVEQRWRELGIVDGAVDEGRAALIFYCGTGWRSSIAFLIAVILGFRAKNYDSGFFGWSWSETNLIVRPSPVEETTLSHSVNLSVPEVTRFSH